MRSAAISLWHRYGPAVRPVWWLVLAAAVAAVSGPYWRAWATGETPPAEAHSPAAAAAVRPPARDDHPGETLQSAKRPRGGLAAVSAPVPLSASPYRNTGLAAHYVGIQECAKCHADEQRSYQGTAHSLALADINPAAEPADGRFFHARSGRTYTVYRRGGQFRHRESALDARGHEYAFSDYPVRYLVGSGRHTRSYLMDIDGFLAESPITWYTSRQRWELSPGYDRPNHKGFERAADATCMVCHAGQIAAPNSDYQRLTFPEQSIGCERCHGPGSIHVSEQRAAGSRLSGSRPKSDAAAASGAASTSIVNPARLNRSLSEAVCAQCHLMGDSLVTVRGRGVADFRPGLPLTDFFINYRLDEPNSAMKVVGHVDQMRLSRCYRSSEQLTCTSCHDPHSMAPPEVRRKQNVQVCLDCHAERGCRLPEPERLARGQSADCLTCHMPQVETDIPHIAFTHHRIGIHASAPGGNSSPSAAPPPASGRWADLVPLDDVSQLGELERDRNLGLAYFGLSQHQGEPAAAREYRDRAQRLLRSVLDRGLSDAEVLAALARLSVSRRDGEAAFAWASQALAGGQLSPKSRVNSLYYIGEIGLRSQRLEPARHALEQLTATRRLSEDWLLLAVCCEASGDPDAALRDLAKAAQIAPFRPEIRQQLAQMYEALGDREAARRERVIAEKLAAQPEGR